MLYYQYEWHVHGDVHRSSERNIVICMLIVYVKGAVIELLFAEFARKNKLSQNSTDEMTAK